MKVEDASSASILSRQALLEAGVVSCYYCRQSYPSDNLKRWTDHGQTAICPFCDMDAVLPGRLEPQELNKLYEYWFMPRLEPPDGT